MKDGPVLNVVIFRLRDEGDSSAYDMESSSIIKLNNSTILYLREVNK